jgi:drug/metabolite transporter (DMT)-like permease
MKKDYFVMILAAALAAVNIPFCEFLLPRIPSLLLAGLTYFGGAIGAGLIWLILLLLKKDKGPFLKGKDWIWMSILNLLDTVANAMLFLGIDMLSGETASLLESTEIVATAIVAGLFFKEKITWRLWLAVAIILSASILLSFTPGSAFSFNYGVLLVIGAMFCWGFTNNFAKKLASRSCWEFTFIKCVVPGTILLIIALSLKGFSTDYAAVGYGLLDGFISYGIAILLLIVGLRHLSASLGTALYSANPFFGAIYALIFFYNAPTWNFYVAMALALVGEFLAGLDGVLIERKAQKEKAVEKSTV